MIGSTPGSTEYAGRAVKRLTIPYARIRMLVDNMPARSTEDQVRARIHECCSPAMHATGLVDKAQDYAVRYFRQMVGRAA